MWTKSWIVSVICVSSCVIPWILSWRLPHRLSVINKPFMLHRIDRCRTFGRTSKHNKLTTTLNGLHSKSFPNMITNGNPFRKETKNCANGFSANRVPVVARSSNRPKVMIFIDGTWLFYSLFYNRELESNPVTRRIGLDWHKKYKFRSDRLCQFAIDKLNHQILEQDINHSNVEIVKAHLFSSMKNDTIVGGLRDEFLSAFKNNPDIDLHIYPSRSNEDQEKCVDVAMAVEMVYLATVPNIYDIALVVGGDRDFTPAFKKVRSLGKKIAVCSVKSTCNKELIRPRMSDFDAIWLDGAIDRLFEPRTAQNDENSDDYMLSRLMKVICTQCDYQQPILSRNLGSMLYAETSESGRSLGDILRNVHGSLKTFVQKYPNFFSLGQIGGEMWEFSITVSPYAIDLFNEATNNTFHSPLLYKDFADFPLGNEADENYLVNVVLNDRNYTLNGRALSEAIGSVQMESGKNCLDAIKGTHRSLRTFLARHKDDFMLGATISTPFGFEYNVTANPLKIAEFKAKNDHGFQYNINSTTLANNLLQKILTVYAKLPEGQIDLSNRDLGRALSTIKMECGKSCLDMIKSKYYCINSFMKHFPEIFSIGETAISRTGYEYLISVDPKYTAVYKENDTDVILSHPEEVAFALNELLQGLSLLKERKNEIFLNDVINILTIAKWKPHQSVLSKLHDLGISLRSFIQYHDQYFRCGPYKMTPNGYEQIIVLLGNLLLPTPDNHG